jgi:hypothetical protein
MAARRAFPGARRCSCPTNSSSVRGRIRAASGSAVSRALHRLSSREVTFEDELRNFFGIYGSGSDDQQLARPTLRALRDAASAVIT